MPPRALKQQKRGVVLVLKLSSEKLADFPSSQTPTKSTAAAKKQSSANTTNVTKAESSPAPDPASGSPTAENQSESNTTPAAVSAAGEANGTPDSSNGLKRKGVPGPKPGFKRSAPSSDPNALPKPRGKPGPKKRKLDGDMNGDPKNAWTTPTTAANHKLGPKANQGAINAGLRALDRTGKPSRKWQKKGFQLKSFTGVSWTMPSWRTPQPRTLVNGENVKSETTGSSEAKNENENASSAVGSESGTNQQKNVDTGVVAPSSDIASSPAPNVSAEVASAA